MPTFPSGDRQAVGSWQVFVLHVLAGRPPAPTSGTWWKARLCLVCAPGAGPICAPSLGPSVSGHISVQRRAGLHHERPSFHYGKHWAQEAPGGDTIPAAIQGPPQTPLGQRMLWQKGATGFECGGEFKELCGHGLLHQLSPLNVTDPKPTPLSGELQHRRMELPPPGRPEPTQQDSITRWG